MTTGNGNILLFYQNLVDTASLSASSSVGTLPVTNLADYRPTIVWRATGRTAEYVQADLGSTQFVQSVIAWNHNWTNASTIRLRVSNNSDMSSPTYDSGTVDGWPSIVGAGEGGAGIGGAGGAPILSAFNQYRFYRVLLIPGSVSGRYVRLDMADPTNSAGYVQMGRLFIGSYLQPTINFQYGWKLGWKDLGLATRTDSGSVRFSKRGKHRVLELSWDYLEQGEALVSFDDIGRIVGMSRDMFAVPMPDAGTSLQYRTAIYGVPTVNGPVAGVSAPAFYSFSLTLEEIT